MDVQTLRLPASLCRRLEEKFLGESGRSLEDFLAAALEELAKDSAEVERAEEEFLEERLRQLGYLSKD